MTCEKKRRKEEAKRYKERDGINREKEREREREKRESKKYGKKMVGG